jgi:hypothetical protein
MVRNSHVLFVDVGPPVFFTRIVKRLVRIVWVRSANCSVAWVGFLKFMSIAGLLLLLGTSVTYAQVGAFPGTAGKVLWQPLVGSGALYEMHFEGHAGDDGTMEVEVLAKERVDGKDAFWIEFSSKRVGKPEWVMKMLIVGHARPGRTLKWIFQLAGHPPMEMPVTMSSEQKHDAPDADELGHEPLTVPAGTFACEHYRLKNGSVETWLNEKIVLWGIVKAQGTSSKAGPWSMILLRTFTDAKDKIIGTPQPFDPKTMTSPQIQP